MSGIFKDDALNGKGLYTYEDGSCLGKYFLKSFSCQLSFKLFHFLFACLGAHQFFKQIVMYGSSFLHFHSWNIYWWWTKWSCRRIWWVYAYMYIYSQTSISQTARGSKNLFNSLRFSLIEVYISGGWTLLQSASKAQWAKEWTFKPLWSMWAIEALFHLLKANFGAAPNPFNSLDSFVVVTKFPGEFQIL